MHRFYELPLSLVLVLLVVQTPTSAAHGLNAFSPRQVISGPGCPFQGGTCSSSGCQEASILCTYPNGTSGNSCCPYVPVPLLFCCDDPQPGGCCNVIANAPGASVSPTIPTPGPSVPVVPDTTISSSEPVLPGPVTTTTSPAPGDNQGGGGVGNGGLASTSITITSPTPVGGGGEGGGGPAVTSPTTSPTVPLPPGGGGASSASITVTTISSSDNVGGGGGGGGNVATTTTSKGIGGGGNGGGGAGGTPSNGTTPVQFQPGVNLASSSLFWNWQNAALATLCGTVVFAMCG